MARVVIIGGTGHIGGYLVPRLVAGGHDGHSTQVPTTEAAPRRPFGEYGTNKAEVERWLLDQARRHGFPATGRRHG